MNRGWIPFPDILPKEDGFYLVETEDGAKGIAYYYDGPDGWFWNRVLHTEDEPEDEPISEELGHYPVVQWHKLP